MVKVVAPSGSMQLIARQVTRLGVQCLWFNTEENQYYVSIKNRTYSSVQPIPEDKAVVWKELLT